MLHTRASAIQYSCSLIHQLVSECSRTGTSRIKLCNILHIKPAQLSMWIKGSRTCQSYYIICNAEEALRELRNLPDKDLGNDKETV